MQQKAELMEKSNVGKGTIVDSELWTEFRLLQVCLMQTCAIDFHVIRVNVNEVHI